VRSGGAKATEAEKRNLGAAHKGDIIPHRYFEERDNVVVVPDIPVPKFDVSNGMVLFAGGTFTVGSADCCQGSAPPHTRSVERFYLDATEVTVAQYREARGGLPPGLQDLAPANEEAVRLVTFDQATWCAELMGKRLPDEVEYEYAATNGGKTRFPWGNDLDRIKGWKFGPVGSTAYDRARDAPSVCGLYSNVAEWTSSWQAPYPGEEQSPELTAKFRDNRIVRGGHFRVIEGKSAGPDSAAPSLWDARAREAVDRSAAQPGLGFRCARSFKPRFPQRDAKEKDNQP
jgi:formylglycine-generating enzyme required for sulfatase activity